MKRSSKKGRETELPCEGAYRQKHFRGMLSRQGVKCPQLKKMNKKLVKIREKLLKMRKLGNKMTKK